MSFKSKMDNGENTATLLMGDSLSGSGTSYYTRRFSQRLADDYDHRVVLKVRNNGGVSTDIVVQAGLSGAPVAEVYVDGVAGATTFREADKAAIFSNLPNGLEFASIFLGINDTTYWYGNQTFSMQALVNNLTGLGNYAKNTIGADVALITPAWNERNPWDHPQPANAAVLCRYVSRTQGFKLIDIRTVFEDHCYAVGMTGNGGQGTWLPNTGDYAHFGQDPHYILGDMLYDAAMTS